MVPQSKDGLYHMWYRYEVPDSTAKQDPIIRRFPKQNPTYVSFFFYIRTCIHVPCYRSRHPYYNLLWKCSMLMTTHYCVYYRLVVISYIPAHLCEAIDVV